MAKVSPEDLTVLARLARSPDWAAFWNLLERELAEHDERCRTLSAPDVYRHQGAASWLVSLKATMRLAKDRATM